MKAFFQKEKSLPFIRYKAFWSFWLKLPNYATINAVKMLGQDWTFVKERKHAG
jgi:hypothetical protein